MLSNDSSTLPDDAVRLIRASVTLRRAANRESTPSASAAAAEADSICGAARTLFEHASLNRMLPSFVSCNVDQSTDTAADDSSNSDAITSESSVFGRTHMHYVLTVLFKNTADSSKLYAAALEISSRAGKSVRDYFDALAHRKRSKHAVVYVSTNAIFVPDSNSYRIHVTLEPPLPSTSSKRSNPPPTQVTPPQQSMIHASLPTADKCVEFYSQRPHLWSVFGHALSPDSTVSEHVSKRRKI